VQQVAASGNSHPTATGLDSRKILVWLFLASECMFFGTLISTYLANRGRSVAGPTPHEILNIPVTSVSTFVLLMSSLAMVLALAAIQRKDIRQFRLFIGLTALLGLTFLGFQVYEFNTFSREGLTLQTNLFGSTFFTLTGFHGAHVSVGVIWLLSLLGFSFTSKMGPEHAIRVELAGLYWHFVDIVWIVIFTVVYLLSNLS
jgi:heme/copper-type cytochrome/quinol oxidase subunit 3